MRFPGDVVQTLKVPLQTAAVGPGGVEILVVIVLLKFLKQRVPALINHVPAIFASCNLLLSRARVVWKMQENEARKVQFGQSESICKFIDTRLSSNENCLLILPLREKILAKMRRVVTIYIIDGNCELSHRQKSILLLLSKRVKEFANSEYPNYSE